MTDYGIGIPDEKLDMVFERFYRVEETMSNFSGMGFGLYIFSEIIHRHRSTIGAKKNGSSGSTFGLNCPNQRNEISVRIKSNANLYEVYFQGSFVG